MEFISDIISQQNYELLQCISLKKYNDECDREEFMNKYYKKNYFKLRIIKKNNINNYMKNIRLISKK